MKYLPGLDPEAGTSPGEDKHPACHAESVVWGRGAGILRGMNVWKTYIEGTTKIQFIPKHPQGYTGFNVLLLR